jgi:hypothetical protein
VVQTSWPAKASRTSAKSKPWSAATEAVVSARRSAVSFSSACSSGVIASVAEQEVPLKSRGLPTIVTSANGERSSTCV